MTRYEDTVQPEIAPCACGCGENVDELDAVWLNGERYTEACALEKVEREKAAEAVDLLTSRWARALCVAAGSKPDDLLGNPKQPRWLGWVYAATLVRKAAPNAEPCNA